jgi:2'-5' RNA ligase
MKQGINIIIESAGIDEIRKKYDKFYKTFLTHLTLVYPFEIKDQVGLEEHIKSSLRGVQPFYATFNKITSSEKGYIYLTAPDAEENLLALYNSLNSNILSNAKNLDFPSYFPHISLGVIEDKELLKKALVELNELDPYFKILINSVSLINLNQDFSARSIKTFKF